jgi:hypothetical protein
VLGAGVVSASGLSQTSQNRGLVAASSVPGSPLSFNAGDSQASSRESEPWITDPSGLRFSRSESSPATSPTPARKAAKDGPVGTGEISTHVISKLGKGSVAGATVRVLYHPDLGASAGLTPGWKIVRSGTLSANGGIDDLIPPGKLMVRNLLCLLESSDMLHAPNHAS